MSIDIGVLSIVTTVVQKDIHTTFIYCVSRQGAFINMVGPTEIIVGFINIK